MKEYKLIINGNNYNVVINELEDTLAEVEVNGTPYQITIDKPIKRLLYLPLPALRVPPYLPLPNRLPANLLLQAVHIPSIHRCRV